MSATKFCTEVQRLNDVSILMLKASCKNVLDGILKYLFSFFLGNKAFCVNGLLGRLFTWNAKPYFI